MAKFVVIDGLDGCGKATQVKSVAEYFNKKGYNVRTMTYPAYDSDSSILVKMYLHGELGKDATEINPYVCASFYAVDRFAQFYQKYFDYFKEDDNTIILADRYVSANVIHQSSKLSTRDDKHNFIKWCYDYECNLGGLPKEDLTILLTIPPKVSQSLINQRYDGDTSKKDIHENSLDYLQHCYDELDDTVKFINMSNTANWLWIDCSTKDNQSIKPIDEITSIIVTAIENIVM